MRRQFPKQPADSDPLLYSGAASEMTGLIPAGHPDSTQRDSYQDVLPYIPPFRNPRPAI